MIRAVYFVVVLLFARHELATSFLPLATATARSAHGDGGFRLASLSSSFGSSSLAQRDPEVQSIIRDEYDRQFSGIELIASENFCSRAVMEALGSCMTNKYSEGRVGARYYGGNQHIDRMEALCQQRALSLYGLQQQQQQQWGVNVQPYSGSPANFAVYTALLQPHDRIMGLDLPSGGHLTHGYQTAKRRVSATSIYFESMPYRVHPQTGLIDYDELAKLALLFKPKMIIAGASAYPRDWDYARMRLIADSVGAYLMADMAHISGLVACGLAASPFEHCDIVTSTTHKSLRGPRSGMIFYKQALGEQINNAVFPALQGGPHNHQIAALAVALKEAATPEFRAYTARVVDNAATLASALVALSPSYVMVTGGTSNHLVLWDLRSLGISGSKMEKALEAVDVSVNKNSVPGDTSAITPGGIRLGTPAMTTRGMGQVEMRTIASLLHQVVQAIQKMDTKSGKLVDFVVELKADKDHAFADIKQQVQKLARAFPMPGVVPQ